MNGMRRLERRAIDEQVLKDGRETERKHRAWADFLCYYDNSTTQQSCGDDFTIVGDKSANARAVHGSSACVLPVSTEY